MGTYWPSRTDPGQWQLFSVPGARPEPAPYVTTGTLAAWALLKIDPADAESLRAQAQDLRDRVYGPELMLRYSDRCAERISGRPRSVRVDSPAPRV